ncbi:hypothetical protein FBUS_02141 [Fasciolopsis buskii]|uniref:Secreted protein n=1 Tax=Fasciolopsis buskii TaxID=27845 RepID=A0A8E0RYF5_9TREM|nr:hypothetical protein FBUS_02141 [Fasciolopsis buski]
MAVLILLCTCCLLHLYVRWSVNGMDRYAGESRNVNRMKSFFDVNIQEQLLLIAQISIQLRVIKLTDENECLVSIVQGRSR